MKRAEIDKIFTRMIGEYLDNGYVINTNTMGGHQGEIAKVDLIKGDDFIRVHLEKGYYDRYDGECYFINVGRSKKKIDPKDRYVTVWTNELEMVSENVIYQIDDDWFTGIKDYFLQCRKIRHDRYKNHGMDDLFARRHDYPEESHKIVLDRVRKLPRCKTVTLKDISKVTKVKRHGTVAWYVVVKDREHKLAEFNVA